MSNRRFNRVINRLEEKGIQAGDIEFIKDQNDTITTLRALLKQAAQDIVEENSRLKSKISNLEYENSLEYKILDEYSSFRLK
jgi:hypothetical protein